MSFQNISSIPIQDFSDIVSNMNSFQDNNVRLQKQKERELYETKMMLRENNLKENSTSDDKNNIINKLRKTLSKKYNLTLNDYIIMIDKFKLNDNKLERNTIINLIQYLNTKSTFSQNTSNEDETSNQIKSDKITPINVDDFEYNLKKMEDERKNYIQNMLNQSSSKQTNLEINSSYAEPFMRDSVSEKINSENNIELNIRDKIDKNINSEIIEQFDINSNQTNLNTNCKEEILMIDLLKNEINGKFIISINYNNLNKIENVVKIVFLGCYINKNLVDKNTDFKNNSIIFKIDEFENNIYINGSDTRGFCQCLLDKKNNYYTYNNSAKIFGVYKPEEKITIEKLNISIFNNLGKNINNLKYTEKDQLSIALKFIIRDT